MAEIVVKSAFVQEWKRDTNDPNPEWGMKVAEIHYRKQGDEFVTAGRTYYTVKAAYGVKIDFRSYRKGDKVTITGQLVTESREYEGKTYNTLTIKAQSVSLVQTDTSEASRQRRFADEEPF